MSAGDAYAAERRRRVLSRLARRLGTRFAVVGAPLTLPASARPLVVCAREGGDVVSHEMAVPVASGALTGVILVRELDGTAAGALAECARLLQPGGVVLAMGELRDEGARREFEAVAAECGLAVELRRPIGPLPARARLPEGLWGIDAGLDSLSVRLGVGTDSPVEMALVLRRSGGDQIELPGMGGMLRQMVLPRVTSVAARRLAATDAPRFVVFVSPPATRSLSLAVSAPLRG